MRGTPYAYIYKEVGAAILRRGSQQAPPDIPHIVHSTGATRSSKSENQYTRTSDPCSTVVSTRHRQSSRRAPQVRPLPPPTLPCGGKRRMIYHPIPRSTLLAVSAPSTSISPNSPSQFSRQFRRHLDFPPKKSGYVVENRHATFIVTARQKRERDINE